jgi:hypothetical protein
MVDAIQPPFRIIHSHRFPLAPKELDKWREAAVFSMVSYFAWGWFSLQMQSLSLTVARFITFGGLILGAYYLVFSDWMPNTTKGFAWFGVLHGVFFCSSSLIIGFLLISAKEALRWAYVDRVRRKSPIAHLIYPSFALLKRFT